MDRKGGLHCPKGSQVREEHESHTRFLDMSVAVNIGLGGLFALEGILVHS